MTRTKKNNRLAKNSNRQPQPDNGNRPGEVVATTWSGPLPPPSVLEGFESIVPGAAERLIRLAEDEALHRRAQESKSLEAEIRFAGCEHRQVYLGQAFAFIIAMTFILGGLWLVGSGAQLAGTFLSFVGVVGIVAAFLKRPSKK